MSFCLGTTIRGTTADSRRVGADVMCVRRSRINAIQMFSHSCVISFGKFFRLNEMSSPKLGA